MAYSVEFTKSTAKEFRKLPKEIQAGFAEKLNDLAADPFPHGVEKVTDTKDCYRIRQGDYRLIYAVKDDLLVVIVLRVSNRKDVYRDIVGFLNKTSSKWDRDHRK